MSPLLKAESPLVISVTSSVRCVFSSRGFYFSPLVLLFLSLRGETALHKAAAACQRTICHYLVEAGASLMRTDLQVTTANG